jgi:hypothetical protein
MLAEREEKERRDLRRRERERRRLAEGDHYDSANDSVDDDESSGSYDSEDRDSDSVSDRKLTLKAA